MPTTQQILATILTFLIIAALCGCQPKAPKIPQTEMGDFVTDPFRMQKITTAQEDKKTPTSALEI